MKIPEDIKVAARRVVDPFLTRNGPIDGFALDRAIAQAIFDERMRILVILARDDWDDGAKYYANLFAAEILK